MDIGVIWYGYEIGIHGIATRSLSNGHGMILDDYWIVPFCHPFKPVP